MSAPLVDESVEGGALKKLLPLGQPSDVPPDESVSIDEGIIDVTHSCDGVPIDLSSPHRNHGHHQQEMM